ADGRMDVEVTRGAIESFREGVSLRSTTAAAVRQVSLVGSGLHCDGSSGCEIEQNTLSGAGIDLGDTAAGGAPSAVVGNVVQGAAGPGVAVASAASGVRIARNVVE